jgi:hypothetical protein
MHYQLHGHVRIFCEDEKSCRKVGLVLVPSETSLHLKTLITLD